MTIWVGSDATRMTINRHTGEMYHPGRKNARPKTLHTKVCTSPEHAQNYARKVGGTAWAQGNVVNYFA